MNRCLRRAWMVLSCLAFFLVTAVQAQGLRSVPVDVKPGILAMDAKTAEITLDGRADRFAPGIRVHDLNNMLILPGSLVGRTVYTVYRREATTGLVHEVWLLTAEEYRKLGGANGGDPDGYKRFIELLNLIFGARAKAGSQ